MNENGSWVSFNQFQNNYGIETIILRHLQILSSVKNAAKIMNLDLSVRPSLDFHTLLYKMNSGRVIDLRLL